MNWISEKEREREKIESRQTEKNAFKIAFKKKTFFRLKKKKRKGKKIELATRVLAAERIPHSKKLRNERKRDRRTYDSMVRFASIVPLAKEEGETEGEKGRKRKRREKEKRTSFFSPSIEEGKKEEEERLCQKTFFMQG